MSWDDREETLRLEREHRDAAKKVRVESVKRLAVNGRSTREIASDLRLSKNTVTSYKRLAGVTPRAPVKHLGGGRWAPD